MKRNLNFEFEIINWSVSIVGFLFLDDFKNRIAVHVEVYNFGIIGMFKGN